VCVPCVVCMFPPVLMALAHPWVVGKFVYNTLGHTGSSFALLLFLVCVLFLSVYSSQFHCCFLICSLLCFKSNIGMFVYMFTMSKEHSLVSLYSLMACRSVIRWMGFRSLYVYDNCK
jgi:hypothetical protein